MKYRKKPVALFSLLSLGFVGALAIRPLCEVAIPTEDLKAIGVVVAAKPPQDLYRAPDLTSMPGAVAVDVVDLQKFEVSLIATDACRRRSTVCVQGRSAKLTPVPSSLSELMVSVPSIRRSHHFECAFAFLRVRVTPSVQFPQTQLAINGEAILARFAFTELRQQADFFAARTPLLLTEDVMRRHIANLA